MKPIFLDRDGVINREPSDFKKSYVTDISFFEILPGVEKALINLSAKGFDIYVMSNQAGVSKGIYPENVLKEITGYMREYFLNKGVKFKDIRYCIHQESENCRCRKPKTGMFDGILENYPDISKLDMFYIGDTERDVETARNLGIKSILVLSGKTKLHDLDSLKSKPDYIADDLCSAVEEIILK
ncbi:MAG: HAD-IIIA family hydrolase [Candidatus Omnitrophica bacterium]|nr:HAD-IIIA family hydrolase [Candidatus Omnitrophota bacterium]